MFIYLICIVPTEESVLLLFITHLLFPVYHLRITNTVIERIINQKLS